MSKKKAVEMLREKTFPNYTIYKYLKECSEKCGDEGSFTWVEEHMLLVRNERVFAVSNEGFETDAVCITDEKCFGQLVVLRNEGSNGVSINFKNQNFIKYNRKCSFTVLETPSYHARAIGDEESGVSTVSELIKATKLVNESIYNKQKQEFKKKTLLVKAILNRGEVFAEFDY